MVAGGLLCCKTCTVVTLHHTHILCSPADVSGTVFFLLFLECLVEEDGSMLSLVCCAVRHSRHIALYTHSLPTS